MKKLIFISIFFALSLGINSQNFTWIKGSNSAGASSIYGVQNVPALSNTPGERHGCAKWIDNSGNLWFFGGEAPEDSWWNDLWRYNIATNEWTWIRGSMNDSVAGNYGTLGISSPLNDPGAREFSSFWTDNSGNFWLYGGKGFDANGILGKLADLWKYNPTTNEWTWVKGPNTVGQPGTYGTLGMTAPTNMPGGRAESAHWKDATGNLWLFGGVGHPTITAQGRLNDLWKYDIASNNWTWVNGSSGPNPSGVYGTLSVPATSNHPGGRESTTCWQIGSDFYLFGGYGRDSSLITPATNFLNDLWKYNPSSNTWVWLGGSQMVNASANYGTQGIPSPANIPGPRRAAAAWVDNNNDAWMFGGGTMSLQYLNDLFRYNPNSNEWTWMKGSNLVDQNGNYGTIGVAAPSNMPGARAYSTFWTDLNGKFWLFGGEGFDETSTSEGHMNDLWGYKTPCNPDTITVSPSNVVCSGANLTLTAVNGGPTTLWYDSSTSTTTLSGGAYFSLPTLTATGASTTFTYYAEANSCTTSPRPSITITVNPLPTLTATASQTTICSGYSATLSVTGANSYTWSTNPAQISNSVLITPNTTTIYTVNGSDLNNCTNSATLQIKVVACPGIKENSAKSDLYFLYPNPSKGEFTIKTDVNMEGSKLSIMNALGEKVYSQVLNSEDSTIKVDLIKGVYFYVISDKQQKQSSGKLIIE